MVEGIDAVAPPRLSAGTGARLLPGLRPSGVTSPPVEGVRQECFPSPWRRAPTRLKPSAITACPRCSACANGVTPWASARLTSAPPATSKRTISVCAAPPSPRMMASSKAVQPRRLTWFTFTLAPRSISSRAASMRLACVAASKAVRWRPSRPSTGVPASSRRRSAARSPASAAATSACGEARAIEGQAAVATNRGRRFIAAGRRQSALGHGPCA